MSFLDWLTSRFHRPQRVGPLDARALAAIGKVEVSFDDREVRCVRARGAVESVEWDDLQIVFIRTTDTGPLFDDMFWFLGGSSRGCIVPSEAAGAQELLERLQKLPGFDNQSLILAAGCISNSVFVCWRRDESAEQDRV